jgi:tetratricopeptide (TPR) repeat protein
MPENASLQQLLQEATSLYHSGNYRQAIDAWRKVLSSEPNNQRAKEGIRMASLLLEEAQIAAAAGPAAGETAAAPESLEVIAKVRAGILKVRELLAASKHIEAMEICQSLLALAPRSAAVHEIVDEAREAYEAQPFIAEHLEIARELFVQERLEEADSELHKVFFLNPNHAEAKKLQAKIGALRQRRAPASAPSGPAPAGPPVSAESGAPAPDLSTTQRVQAVPDFGDTLDLPEPEAPGEPSSRPGAASGEGDVKAHQDAAVVHENWEAELAQLNLGTSSAPPAAPRDRETTPPEPEEPVERLEIMDLSEESSRASVVERAPESAGPSAPPAARPAASPEADLDLSGLGGEGLETSREEEAAIRRRQAPRTLPAEPRRPGGSSVAKFALPVMGLLIGGTAAWWYFGMKPASSGHGGEPPVPPPVRAPHRVSPGVPAGTGSPGRTNLGLSSSGSRGSGGTASAGVEIPGADPSAAARQPSAQDVRREMARLTEEGRSHLAKGRYPEAVKSFSAVLDLDPANIEAKEQLDQAASKVLEQKRLEEDLQTAKEFFVEKDYESALRKFYRLPRDRNLGEVDLFIRNAWYNWAVVSMKGGNCVDALSRLKEALTLDPGDSEASKLQEVAEAYRDKPKDKVFYAYSDRITYRTLNQK